MGLSKSTWYYREKRKTYEEKYSYLRKPLMDIAEEHHGYGYRKTTEELHHRGYCNNHKVIEKLNRLWYLSLGRKVKTPKPNPLYQLLKEVGKESNLVTKLKEINVLEVLYTDFTEILYGKGRLRAQLMPIVDHTSKLVAGHALGPSANTDLAFKAWERAKKRLDDLGQPLEDVIIHHDKDGVYLSHRWVNEIVIKSRARISYSERGAKENVHMESFNGHFKQENRDLFWEQEDIESLRNIVNERLRYYNLERRHSALGNISPIEYLKKKGRGPSEVSHK